MGLLKRTPRPKPPRVSELLEATLTAWDGTPATDIESLCPRLHGLSERAVDALHQQPMQHVEDARIHHEGARLERVERLEPLANARDARE